MTSPRAKSAPHHPPTSTRGPQAPSLTRRQILAGSGLAGAAALTGAGYAGGAEAAGVTPDDPRRVTLTDSPHIRTYYALARD